MTETSIAPVDPTRVLLVEHLAHERAGHYMSRLAEIGDALIADGHEVHVLTSSGLAIDAEGGRIAGIAGVHRTAPVWRLVLRTGVRVRQQGAPTRAMTTLLRMVGSTLTQVAAIRGIARCVARLGGSDQVAVIVLSPLVQITWAHVLAPRRPRWMILAHKPPPPVVRGTAALCRAASAVVAVRARRRGVGWIHFACSNDALVARWAARHAWTAPVVVALAGTVPVQRIPRPEARARLGLPIDERIALQFGSAHGGKDMRTPLLAFAGTDAPARLVVAGRAVDRALTALRRTHGDMSFPAVTLLPGPQDDTAKRLLHAAADFAVLSFRPQRVSDSATLTDAVSYGLPVCCTAGTLAGSFVERFGLGLTFAASDPAALRAAAVEIATFVPDADGVARFSEERSTLAIARRLMYVATTP